MGEQRIAHPLFTEQPARGFVGLANRPPVGRDRIEQVNLAPDTDWGLWLLHQYDP